MLSKKKKKTTKKSIYTFVSQAPNYGMRFSTPSVEAAAQEMDTGKTIKPFEMYKGKQIIDQGLQLYFLQQFQFEEIHD